MTTGPVTVPLVLALITCIVQRGVAETVVRAAQQSGAQGATVHFARGTGVRERLGLLGLAVEVEKEVINIIVANDYVDRVFERMYAAGKLDTPGMGKLTPAAYRQLGNETQKEIVTVVVPADQADDLFRYVFHEAQIDRPHGGIMFMHALGRATPFTLPEVPEET